MPIQNVNHVKKIAFSPSVGDVKRRHSTTPLKTPFRHLTQFPLSNPLHLLQIMTESVTAKPNVRFGSLADIAQRPPDVRFTPKSRHWLSVLGCPLCAKSGHYAVQQPILTYRGKCTVEFSPVGGEDCKAPAT